MLAAFGYSAPGFSGEATNLYRRAQKLEKTGNIVQAYVLYAEAAVLEPKNKLYSAKAASLQGKADQLQKLIPPKPVAPAVAAPDTGADGLAAEAEPEPEYSSVTARELASARQALGPAEVKMNSGHFDFHLSVSSMELFNQIAQRCGLQTEFDSEYSQAPQKVRFDIDDVDCRDALHAAEAATSSFIAPLSSKLIFISKDTNQKRQANEQTMAVVVPVPTSITPQDLTEISQAVKQVSGVEKLSWNSASNEIVIRDRVSRVLIARALIEQLTAYRGGVIVELRFLQLSNTDMLTYGVNLTNSFSLIWSGNQALASAGATLNTVIRALEHGTKFFGISALQASVVAQLSQSTAKTILQTQIRSINGMPATFHVGEKYPILTAGYFGGTAAAQATATSGTAYTPPASFTYQDLGVSLKVLPTITNTDLISMEVESEYQLLAGQSLDGVPILANRKFATKICIHNNEWAVIAGLMDDTDTKSISGVAGLARIPLLGWLFKTQNHEKDRDHIVIVMRPHIVGDPPSSHETAPMPVGSETRPFSPI